jgi:hypothetical protein
MLGSDDSDHMVNAKGVVCKQAGEEESFNKVYMKRMP